jgi:hypothetical protein
MRRRMGRNVSLAASDEPRLRDYSCVVAKGRGRRARLAQGSSALTAGRNLT